MKRLVVLAILATASVAYAEPEPTRYLELGPSLGVWWPAGPGIDFGAAFGVRRSEHGWLRFAIAAGSSARYIDEGSAGPLVQARVGDEGRGCIARGIVCGVAGIDVAVFFARNTDPDIAQASSFLGVLVVPRFGLDFGTRRVRLGIGLEAGVGFAATLAGPSRGGPAVMGGLNAGLAFRW